MAVGQSAVVFQSLPRDLQLFPRNGANQAAMVIEGTVTDASATRVTLQLDRAGKLTQAQQYSLPVSRTFRFEATIRAELAEYTVRVHLHRRPGDSVLVAERKRLLCGDLFLIYGQSNATGLANLHEIKVNDQFMRQCSYPYGSVDIPSAMQWFPALQPYAAVGAVGLYMGEAIQKATQIPIGFINGAEGGAGIGQLSERNATNPADLNTVYGRMLFRAQWAGVHHQLKAIIYKQGEAEAGSSTANYPANFDRLYRMFRQDYGNVPRFYASQINLLSNGSPDTGALRDFQRRLTDIYPQGVGNIATVGAVGYDGLHYGLSGSQQIGYEQAGQILRDLYASGASEQVNSPNVRQVFQNSSNDTLTIVFETGMQLRWPADSVLTKSGQSYTRRLIDVFLADGQSSLFSAGRAEANRVYLALRQPAAIQSLSYFPPFYNEGPSGFYDGPTLKNQLGVRAFTFDRYPVARILPAKMNLAVASITGEDISLSWTVSASEAVAILLDRSSDGGSSFTQIARLPASTTAYTDIPTGNSSGSYAYRIRVAGQQAESGISNVVVGKLLNPCALIATVTGNTVVPYGGTLSLSMVVTGAATGNPLTYLWRGPGGLVTATPNLTQQSLTPGLSGTYSVTVTQGICSATTSIAITINAPLASGVSSPDLPVWPNPARSGQVVYLNVPEASLNEAVNIVLFDRAGKPVFEQVQRKQSGPLFVALPSLPAGLYIVEMTPSAATRISRRLLIE